MDVPMPPIPPVTYANLPLILFSLELRLLRPQPYIAAGCIFKRRIARIAELGRSADLRPGMRGQPAGPVRPPASSVFSGLLEPALGYARHVGRTRGIVRPIAAPFFGRRIDDARYMA